MYPDVVGCKLLKFSGQVYSILYNNQIDARALIGQSGVGYCYYKPTGKLRVF